MLRIPSKCKRHDDADRDFDAPILVRLKLQATKMEADANREKLLIKDKNVLLYIIKDKVENRASVSWRTKWEMIKRQHTVRRLAKREG